MRSIHALLLLISVANFAIWLLSEDMNFMYMSIITALWALNARANENI